MSSSPEISPLSAGEDLVKISPLVVAVARNRAAND
jgi:hypothetical protein